MLAKIYDFNEYRRRTDPDEKYFIAHIRKDGTIQTVREHCVGTAEIAKSNAHIGHFYIPNTAYLLGIMHDMGKYNPDFREYILEATQDPTIKRKIDHSTAGAKYLYDNFCRGKSSYIIELLCMCIMCHHTGLQDFSSPEGTVPDIIRRLSLVDAKDLPGYETARDNFLTYVINETEIKRMVNKSVAEMSAIYKDCFVEVFDNGTTYENIIQKDFNIALVTQMVFSILIDADRLDTAKFMLPERAHEYRGASYG